MINCERCGKPYDGPVALTRHLVGDHHVNLNEAIDESRTINMRAELPLLRIEGNNGGDYLTIKPLGGNLVALEIGHCCVVTIRHVVPIEWITAVLTEDVLQHENVKDAVNALGWSKDFTSQLAAQVQAIE